jgi:tRNA A-37 threonylcarbamoyl transferase component Bud32
MVMKIHIIRNVLPGAISFSSGSYFLGRCDFMSSIPCEGKIEFHGEPLALPSLETILREATLLRGSTSFATGEVYRWNYQGRDWLVKTFAHNGWLSRHLLGKFCMRNEWRILTTLRDHGVTAAPEPLAFLGNYTIVMEYLHGHELESSKYYRRTGETPPSREFYLSLKEILASLHQKGFAHGDFRRANILVSEDGKTPRIIDWATCMVNRGAKKLLFHAFQDSDRFSLAKILLDADESLLTPEEQKSIRPSWFLRAGRFLRQNVYRKFIKPVFHSKK